VPPVLVEELSGVAMEAATHRIACRVFCRLAERSADDEAAMLPLFSPLLENAAALCRSHFGSYVAATAVEHGPAEWVDALYRGLCEAAQDGKPLMATRKVMFSFLNHGSVAQKEGVRGCISRRPSAAPPARRALLLPADGRNEEVSGPDVNSPIGLGSDLRVESSLQQQGGSRCPTCTDVSASSALEKESDDDTLSWFPAAQLPKILAFMDGSWVDDRSRTSRYVVSVYRKGNGDATIHCATERLGGYRFEAAGRVLKLQWREGHEYRVVWGLWEVRFVATVKENTILWTPTRFGGRPYLWTKEGSAERGAEEGGERDYLFLARRDAESREEATLQKENQEAIDRQKHLEVQEEDAQNTECGDARYSEKEGGSTKRRLRPRGGKRNKALRGGSIAKEWSPGACVVCGMGQVLHRARKGTKFCTLPSRDERAKMRRSMLEYRRQERSEKEDKAGSRSTRGSFDCGAPADERGSGIRQGHVDAQWARREWPQTSEAQRQVGHKIMRAAESP
jgi:hypothetical protein